MRDLCDGIRQFRSQVFEVRRSFFEELARAQKPDALFITCSDSRIDPNLITGCQPGELFVLRNVGNLVPAYDANSAGDNSAIEYAIGVLSVEDILICGHTGCGAIDALLNPEHLHRLPAVGSWLGYADTTLSILEERLAREPNLSRFDAAVEANVLSGLGHLRTHPVVADRLAAGRLRLHGWVYRMETGELTALDEATGRFRSIGPEEFTRQG